jgi:hypothetical protein
MLRQKRAGSAAAKRSRGSRPGRVLTVLPALLVTGAIARAELPANEVVLEDSIAIEILDRTIVAFDLLGSGRLDTRLEIDEEVLWYGSRGRVAIVLTSRRLLGATPQSSDWRQERYRLDEAPARVARLSSRLAVAITPQRILGFFGSGNWAEVRLGLREAVVDARVGPGTGVIVTNRRALALSSDSGGFFETKLQIREQIESVRTLASIATVTTSERTLVFKGPSGIWSGQQRSSR